MVVVMLSANMTTAFGAGFNSAEVLVQIPLAIDSVAVTGVKTIEVKLNKAVDSSDASLKIMEGAVGEACLTGHHF